MLDEVGGVFLAVPLEDDSLEDILDIHAMKIA